MDVSSIFPRLMGIGELDSEAVTEAQGKREPGGLQPEALIFSFMPSSIIVLSSVILTANLHFAGVRTYF